MVFVNRRYDPSLFGGPFPVWLLNRELIDDFVKEFKLEPMGGAGTPVSGRLLKVVPEEAEREVFKLKYEGIDGGMRGPHLHVGGEVYMLDARTWGVFTERMVATFAQKLQSAQAVSFEQFMEVSSAVEALTMPAAPAHTAE